MRPLKKKKLVKVKNILNKSWYYNGYDLKIIIRIKC